MIAPLSGCYPENSRIPRWVNFNISTRRYFHPSVGDEFFRHGPILKISAFLKG
ncbi:hypothetical protein B4135_0378 [Caldibacillus debilis]|uniref:Uncharacterized protein n=1 Tax=Caldibacillus debilis TaxID=301148 RepID=A0A150LLA4_9BACI|nr:hypothetical protein B4135_0378 [Caldibacillus debilis]